MIRSWLTHLDAYGMDDPDNNEGFIEDRCNVCDHPMIDHPGHEAWNGLAGSRSAKWPHRRKVIVGLLAGSLP